MSVNIRDYVSNDHVESIVEIVKNQGAIIQALSIDNSKLEQELQRKDNIINEMKKASDEIFHKYPYERKKWFDKIEELEKM